MLTDEALQQRCVAGGYRRLAEFDIGHVAAQYLAMYSELARARPEPSSRAAVSRKSL
jgi:hypothetical protein